MIYKFYPFALKLYTVSWGQEYINYIFIWRGGSPKRGYLIIMGDNLWCLRTRTWCMSGTWLGSISDFANYNTLLWTLLELNRWSEKPDLISWLVMSSPNSDFSQNLSFHIIPPTDILDEFSKIWIRRMWLRAKGL